MTDESLQVAIVGGGIVGLAMASGLLKRNIQCRVYERAASLRETGAGIGFSPNAERAMMIVDPRIHAAFKKVATPNASDWFQYVDGQCDSDELKHLFKIYLGERAFEGCSRPDFLDELAKLLPEDTVEFRKELDAITDAGEKGKVLLGFTDGTKATADIVIGCDGIHSKVRQIVLGRDSPAAEAHYTHKYAIRGLIPMAKATESLGEAKTCTRFMHIGPDAHILTFPVGMGAFLNVVGFISDPKEWPHESLTAKMTREEASKGFVKFGPTVRKIIDLLPDSLDQWAVFDTYDHLAPTYVCGNIVLAGDAAHAAAPHHGAGAGLGIEDAAALCALIEKTAQIPSGRYARKKAIEAALVSYDFVRRERCEWVVESSRFIGELYEWQTLAGSDAEKCHKEAYDRSHRIWDYDVDEMVRNAQTEFKSRME